MRESTINKLIEMGASRWTKSGHDRLYLNDAALKMLELEIEYYRSGYVSCAKLHGEIISNTRGRELVEAIDGLYVDIETGEVVRGRRRELNRDCMDEIAAFIAALEDEGKNTDEDIDEDEGKKENLFDIGIYEGGAEIYREDGMILFADCHNTVELSEWIDEVYYDGGYGYYLEDGRMLGEITVREV